MGCWLGTCAVTNLSIFENDPIRAYILSRSQTHDDPNHRLYDATWGGGYTYVEDVWFPHFLPLKGLYDDYGGITEVERDFNSTIVEHTLRKHVVETPDNRRCPVKKDGTFEDLLGWIERGEVQLKDRVFGGSMRLGLMLVHESAFQFVVGLGEDIGHRLSPLVYGTYKLDYVDTNSYVYAVALHDLDYRHCFMPSMVKHLPAERHEEFYTGTKTGPELDELKALTFDHAKFAFGMSKLRKGFMPQAGKGSQDENDEEIGKLAGFTKKLIAEQKKRHR